MKLMGAWKNFAKVENRCNAIVQKIYQIGLDSLGIMFISKDLSGVGLLPFRNKRLLVIFVVLWKSRTVHIFA